MRDLAKLGKSSMGWFYGFKLHLACNEKGEILTSFFSPGNTDDCSEQVFDVLRKKLFRKLYADKGYISASLFESLFNKEFILSLESKAI